jgi:hypothetical protein
VRAERVLTPSHEGWIEFVDELSRALICTGTTMNARRLLARMHGIDVEGSLEALRQLGGRCDCEIVYELAQVEPSTAIGDVAR